MDRDEVWNLRKLSRATNSPYAFTTERGGPLSVGALEYIVRKAGKRAGLPVETQPHMLRHAAGYAPIMLAMRAPRLVLARTRGRCWHPRYVILHRGIATWSRSRRPAGELSDPQQAVMAAVLASGGRVGVLRDADEMLGLLDAWGIPRARRLLVRASVAP
jgi:hypothetical protein